MGLLATRLYELIDAGWNPKTWSSYVNWSDRVESFLKGAMDADAAKAFSGLNGDPNNWEWKRHSQIGMLEGLALRAEQGDTAPVGSAAVEMGSPHVASGARLSKRIFIVHGHDSEPKESVARFIERLGLEPIILHEQPNSGRTVIEKFEVFADVGFAVVLLTPDDVGGSSDKQNELKARARQNVVLELGYFVGRLSRHRVCALFKKDVEIPSDLHGVLFVEFDPAGAWRTKLAQELVEAGIQIKLDALIK